MKHAYLWPVLIMFSVFVVSGQSDVAAPSIDLPRLDLLAHFAVFGALATSIIRLPAVYSRGWKGAVFAVLVTSVFGGLDEWRQSFTPGRFMAFDDWVADTLGALAAVLLYTRCPLWRKVLETPLSTGSAKRPGPVSGSRVFGMSPERGRWMYVGLGLLSLLCMGTAYSWSIFRGPLQEHFGISSTQSLLPFTVFLVMYALLMPVAGVWMERLGPGKTMAVGGGMLCAGYLLAGFAANPLWLVVSYGGLAGAGVGVAYGVPLAVSTRWFPDKKGLALGITVIGFGLSPLVTAPIANVLIETSGVMSAFRWLGLAFGGLVCGVAALTRFPPAGWIPRGVPESNDRGGAVSVTALTPVWKLQGFLPLWICFAIGTYVGLSVIGISSAVALEVAGMAPARAAGLVSLFAVFNGAGRPLFGWLTDRLRPARAAILAFFFILSACLLLFFAGEGRPWVYVVCFCVLWMCLGGWLAIAPTATALLFPAAGYAKIYGFLFTAYGVGALLGTMTAGRARDMLGSYRFAFVPMAALALVGMAVAWLGLGKPGAVKPRG